MLGLRSLKALLTGLFLSTCVLAMAPFPANSADPTPEQITAYLSNACAKAGWEQIDLTVAGKKRRVLYKGSAQWDNGAILVLHGGGGEATHFCAGGKMLKPQIEFAALAVESGFGVFLLESTNDLVTDEKGRKCGKRFDFSVLDRPNIDLPYIEEIITEIIPGKRPGGGNASIFMTGLSTGGYMTIRASTHFNEKITAFAPVSAGDPYGTDTVCDTSLSERTTAKGILKDRETGKQIIVDDACLSTEYKRESSWDSATSGPKPAAKQFQHRLDGVVDITCMQKVTTLLKQNGYPVEDGYVIRGMGSKKAQNHLWLKRYNKRILEFFSAQTN
jgi:hypothetical protein